MIMWIFLKVGSCTSQFIFGDGSCDWSAEGERQKCAIALFLVGGGSFQDEIFVSFSNRTFWMGSVLQLAAQVRRGCVKMIRSQSSKA